MIYRILLTGDELILIGSALEVLPYAKVAKVITHIQSQIAEQEADELARAEPAAQET